MPHGNGYFLDSIAIEISKIQGVGIEITLAHIADGENSL